MPCSSGGFLTIVSVPALASSLAAKQRVKAIAGTFQSHTPIFVGLVAGVIVWALTFFPVRSLGPVVAHFLLRAGQAFSGVPIMMPAATRRRVEKKGLQVELRSFRDPEIGREAIGQSFVKLNPATLWRNPVMLVVEIGSVLSTGYFIADYFRRGG